MKRHKRDRTSRAWQKGYQAGLIGRSRDTCPHQIDAHRTSWIEGWEAGQADLSDGVHSVGGLHKRAAM